MQSALIVLALTGGFVQDDATSATLAEHKRASWSVVDVIGQRISDKTAFDARRFPGQAPWFEEYARATRGFDSKKPVEQWPALESNKLLTRNPRYWRMHFEIAPGDPALAVLHAGLLQMAGETERASYLLVIAGQVPGIPADLRDAMISMVRGNNATLTRPAALVNEGIALHDKGDFDGAVAKYDAALKLHPQHGHAWYERGYSLRSKAWKSAGIPEQKQGTVSTDENLPNDPKEVTEAFARARRYDPFQYMAYQGRDQQVLAGLQALVKKGMPAWKRVEAAFGPGRRVPDTTLRDLGDALQEAGAHDLALFTRQVLVIRRGRYAPEDYPFLEKSLKALASGEPIDRTLALLNGPNPLALRQLTKLEAPPSGASEKKEQDEFKAKTADVDHIVLLVPTNQVSRRVGEDIDPFASYVNGVMRKVDEIVTAHSKPADVQAKGMMVSIGIKSKTSVRVWCEAIDGAAPDDLLRRVEREIAALPAVELQQPPMAFALNMTLFGRKPAKFDKVPPSWADAAKKHGVKIVIPPDELFKHLWPD